MNIRLIPRIADGTFDPGAVAPERLRPESPGNLNLFLYEGTLYSVDSDGVVYVNIGPPGPQGDTGPIGPPGPMPAPTPLVGPISVDFAAVLPVPSPVTVADDLRTAGLSNLNFALSTLRTGYPLGSQVECIPYIDIAMTPSPGEVLQPLFNFPQWPPMLLRGTDVIASMCFPLVFNPSFVQNSDGSGFRMLGPSFMISTDEVTDMVQDSYKIQVTGVGNLDNATIGLLMTNVYINNN